MIWIDVSDITPKIRAYNLDHLIESDAALLDTAELDAIQLVRDYGSSLYDMNWVFAQTGAARHRTIVQCVVDLMLYELYQRIADIMMSERVVKNYDDRLTFLKGVANGDITLSGVPTLEDANGEPKTVFQWGSNERRSY